MKKQIAFAALAVALGAGVAVASPGDRMGRMFERIDADGSGSISKDEARTMHSERFGRMDADGDGILTLEEFAKHRGGHGHHGRHGDGDRMGDRDARIEQRFDRLDANDDDAVTLDEMKSAADTRTERREAMRAERFANFDADKDGGISEQEFVTGGVERMFGHADSDGDGTITREEMRTAHEAMREARKARKAE